MENAGCRQGRQERQKESKRLSRTEDNRASTAMLNVLLRPSSFGTNLFTRAILTL